MERTSVALTPLAGAARSIAMEVLLRGPVSRSELARRLDLSPATLTRVTRPLIDRGLLVEADTERDGRTGRPSKPLDIAPDSHHFVGINLTGDEATAVVTNLRAEVLASERAPLEDRDPDAVVATVAALVDDLRHRAPGVAGLSISLGGHVDDHRTVTRAPFLGWPGAVELADLAQAATGLPCVVDNDLLALTRAEHWFGIGREVDRFAIITTGASVGYGLVVHDEIVDSPDAGIGLVGHYPLDPFGPPCPDGHRGCANSMLSIPSITSSVTVGLGRPVTYDECLDLALADDPVAVAIVTASGRALGRLIAATANLTMTTTVVVTGEGSRLADTASRAVHEGISTDRDPRATPITLDVQPVDFTKHARGAAVTAIQQFGLGTA